MSTELIVEAAVEEFKKRFAIYCEEAAKKPLSVETAAVMTEGIQHCVQGVGQAAFRAYLESKDEKRDVVTRDGELYRYKFDSAKEYETLWGPTKVWRALYQNASDSASYVPLDEAWGMEKERMTVEVREAVSYSCGHVTPDETYALLKKCALFHPHPTQIKECVKRIGRQIEAHREVLEERIRAEEEVPETTRVLAASMDGANVLLNERGWKRGRPAERPTGGQGGEAPTSYKNAMVGSLSFYGDVAEGESTPQRLGGRYTARMPEEAAVTFKRNFEAELDAVERLLPLDAVKVLLCDGARALWKYAEQTPRFDGYEKIIDYCHTLEHLSRASEALFGKGSDKGTRWYQDYARKLLEEDDGAQRVLHSMSYFAKTLSLSKASRNELEIQLTFFRRNKDKMSYADFRRRGLPIGSGPVEAACKTLVKARLCRSGMRWSRQGGQNILNLRTYIKSNRWEVFWKHLNQLPKAS